MDNGQVLSVGGEKLLTPRAVRHVITEALGAEFSQRQVDRLGTTKVLEPRLIAGRRFYRLADVEKLLKNGHIAVSDTLPGRARLIRREARTVTRRKRAATKRASKASKDDRPSTTD